MYTNADVICVSGEKDSGQQQRELVIYEWVVLIGTPLEALVERASLF